MQMKENTCGDDETMFFFAQHFQYIFLSLSCNKLLVFGVTRHEQQPGARLRRHQSNAARYPKGRDTLGQGILFFQTFIAAKGRARGGATFCSPEEKEGICVVKKKEKYSLQNSQVMSSCSCRSLSVSVD